MGKPMNYDDYASKYANTRQPVPWVLEPILNEVKALPKASSVLEVGCGTGNYIIGIENKLPGYKFYGFDLSGEMLRVARERSKGIEFTQGNADERIPYPDNMFALEFMVDVIHHVTKMDVCFREINRTLADNGILLIVTDSYEDMHRRSLTKFFPEILGIELDRYPSFDELNLFAGSAGLKLAEMKQLNGSTELTDDFVSKLEQKCSSAMRLMPDEHHRKGMERVREAQKKGEKWNSYYTFLKYGRGQT